MRFSTTICLLLVAIAVILSTQSSYASASSSPIAYDSDSDCGSILSANECASAMSYDPFSASQEVFAPFSSQSEDGSWSLKIKKYVAGATRKVLSAFIPRQYIENKIKQMAYQLVEGSERDPAMTRYKIALSSIRSEMLIKKLNWFIFMGGYSEERVSGAILNLYLKKKKVLLAIANALNVDDHELRAVISGSRYEHSDIVRPPTDGSENRFPQLLKESDHEVGTEYTNKRYSYNARVSISAARLADDITNLVFNPDSSEPVKAHLSNGEIFYIRTKIDGNTQFLDDDEQANSGYIVDNDVEDIEPTEGTSSDVRLYSRSWEDIKFHLGNYGEIFTLLILCVFFPPLAPFFLFGIYVIYLLDRGFDLDDLFGLIQPPR